MGLFDLLHIVDIECMCSVYYQSSVFVVAPKKMCAALYGCPPDGRDEFMGLLTDIQAPDAVAH